MATRNRLFNALSQELREELTPHMSVVTLQRDTVLYRSGELIQDVYFPLSCLLSITITMSDGATSETALLGRRDMLGINVVLSRPPLLAQTTYTVQSAGDTLMLDAETLRELFSRHPELRNVLLSYTQALIAQISQTAACNSLHSLEQRFARWLLEAQDRLGSNQLRLTQEIIAAMLGVRRSGVTLAAQKLQEQGVIYYKRGYIEILDQKGLEAGACECFRCVKDEYDRLIGPSSSDEP